MRAGSKKGGALACSALRNGNQIKRRLNATFLLRLWLGCVTILAGRATEAAAFTAGCTTFTTRATEAAGAALTSRATLHATTHHAAHTFHGSFELIGRHFAIAVLVDHFEAAFHFGTGGLFVFSEVHAAIGILVELLEGFFRIAHGLHHASHAATETRGSAGRSTFRTTAFRATLTGRSAFRAATFRSPRRAAFRATSFRAAGRSTFGTALTFSGATEAAAFAGTASFGTTTAAHLFSSGLQLVLIGHAVGIGVDLGEAVFTFLLREGEELVFGDLAIRVAINALEEFGHAIAAISAGAFLAVLGVGQACGRAAGDEEKSLARFHVG